MTEENGSRLLPISNHYESLVLRPERHVYRLNSWQNTNTKKVYDISLLDKDVGSSSGFTGNVVSLPYGILLTTSACLGLKPQIS